MKKIVCIIDDDIIYQFIMKRFINKNDLARKTLLFDDGDQAIDYFKTSLDNPDFLPDIILLDINMPNKNAWQFMKEYIELKPLITKEIKIFVVSSILNTKVIERIFSYADICGYNDKPIEEEEIKALINRVID